jgi:hypothetical protein
MRAFRRCGPLPTLPFETRLAIALYQGTTLVVPSMDKNMPRLQPLRNFLLTTSEIL